MVSALTNDAAKNKTFELVAERGEEQADLTPLFEALQMDNPKNVDGILDMNNMSLADEPDCIVSELNALSYS